jgi:MFS transporter, FSR family, fosmidomycin resistance protein
MSPAGSRPAAGAILVLPMRKSVKLSIGYTTAAHTLVHMLELTYGVVLISIRPEFGVEEVVLGALANVLGFTFGLTALPAGFLIDRIGERRLLVICSFGMALAAVGTGLAPNVIVLGVMLGLLGMSMGIFHPAATTFIARIAPRRGLGFGLLGVGGSLGLALGPICAGAAAAAMGWRAAYFVLAVPALILAILFLTTRPDPENVTTEESPAPPVVNFWRTLKPVAPLIFLILMAQVLAGLIYRGVVTYLPTHLSDMVNIGDGGLSSLMRAGVFTTVVLAFGVIGQFGGGYLGDHVRREKLAVISALVTLGMLMIMGLGQGWGLLLGSMGFAVFYFMGQPVYNSLIADYTPESIRGRIYGLSFFAGFGLGSFSASLFGYVVEKLDTGWVFLIAAVFSALMLVITLTLFYKARHRKSESGFPVIKG